MLKRVIRLIRRKGPLAFLRILATHYLYKFYVRKRLPAKCPITPTRLQIEVSTRCNLSCKICERSYQKNSNHLMSLANFKKILSKFPSLTSLDMTGFGEVFCNPEFVEMIRTARNRGLKVEFNTNGLLMTPEKADQIVEVDSITFSIDAATKATYEAARTGGDFDKLISNISYLSKKIPQIGLSFTIRKDNLAEALQFPQLAKRVGANKILFRDLVVFSGGSYNEEDKVKFSSETVRIKEEISAACDYLNIKTVFSPSFYPPTTIACHRPWKSCYVDVFGNMYPCCRTRINFGNLLESKLTRIWNSSKYILLRRELLHPTHIPSPCKGCDCLVKGDDS